MGILHSVISQGWPPKSKFSVDDIPDLSGKVTIVTGGYAGIGKETVKALLSHNAKVYIAARSSEKGEEAIADLKTATGKEAIFLKLDLANLKSVKEAADEFLSKETELHVLFNNGGVMIPPIDQLTADGYDLQFGTNVLGHFYFTKLLLPILISTAKSSPDGKARVVNSSSLANEFCTIYYDTLKDGPQRKKMGTQRLYCQSKFANVAMASELARQYADQGIVSTSLNPGNIKSELQRHVPGYQHYIMDKFILFDTPYGALTQLWAGTTPEGLELNGKHLIPWARIGKPHAESQKPETGQALWAWLEEQVKDK